MKKGLSQLVLSRDWSLEKCLKFCKSAGYDGLEVRMTDDQDVSLNASDEQLKSIKEMSKDIGVELCSIVPSVSQRGALTSPDAAERKQGRETITRLLEVASALKINAALVVPGAVTEAVPYDVAYKNALRSVKQLAPVAEKTKVYLSIENVWNKFLLSPLEMRTFLDEIGNRYVGMFFDTGNVVIYGFPEQWLNIMGRRIKKIHVKDFKRQGYQWVPLMEGDVNWRLVMAAIRKNRYNDYLISEVGGTEKIHKATAKAIKKIIEM